MKLIQYITDERYREISDITEEKKSPAFIDIDSSNGEKILLKFIATNDTEYIEKISKISVTPTIDIVTFPSDTIIKLIKKQSKPTLTELDAISNMNELIFTDELELQQGDSFVFWMYIDYPGASRLGLLKAIEKTFFGSIDIDFIMV